LKKYLFLRVIFFIVIFFYNPLSSFSLTAREYLPGDFVHIIVDAPLDTAQMSAVMPDGTIINMVQERRRTIWRGIWQVPLDFKQGTYSAKLSAIDLEGNVFDGLSDSFVVGQLSLTTLVAKPTIEAAPKVTLRQTITIEVPSLTGVPEKKIISTPVAGPPPEMMPEEKAKLIERNLISAKSELAQGKFSEAISYLRVVIFLDPKNKDGSLYLAEAQKKKTEADKLLLSKQAAKDEETNKQSQSILISVLIGLLFVGLLGAAIILLLTIKAPARKAAPIEGGPEKILSEKEMQVEWYKKLGWTKNPFTQDIFAKLFSGYHNLEIDALKGFIKARIEGAGGKGHIPFTESAIDEIFSFSKGKPSDALKVCDCAVTETIRQNLETINAEIIKSYEEIKTPHILIVDDEEVIRTTLEGILKLGGGYITSTAIDGEETLAKIRDNNYDLVLLDIQLPKINGYEVLKQARNIRPTLPIVFVTGKGTAEETLKIISQYSLTSYIAKPFTPEKVLDTVAKILKVS